MTSERLPVVVLFNAPSPATRSEDRAAEAGVQEAAQAAAGALQHAGHRVEIFPLGDDFLPLAERLRAEPAIVVNFCEGFRGRSAGEAFVTGLLELLDAPYTGSPPGAMLLCLDKLRTKRLLAGAGLPTPPFVELARSEQVGRVDQRVVDAELAWPLIVKPAGEDASQGLTQQSVVEEPAKLRRAVEQTAAAYGYPVLIEEFIDGREFNLAVIEDPEPRLLPISEILFETSRDFRWPMVTYEAKWVPGSRSDRATVPRCPAPIDAQLAAELERLALEAFRLTGCRDYARIDVRLARNGRPFLLEVNANPDLSPSAGLARQLEAAGIDYADFLVRLVERAASSKAIQKRGGRL